ncbi:tRNA (adenosine(37)-N6)-dimethylallyltransferase MiaA [Streptococcus caviae]|uniref:tRNA (adenosine(37)-N6)-dimethylallyltransferase MiaA n=1 Tax=Streptococcus sp. 'caviae' TaxID=1915004 RepID=UPI00094BC1AD|nr:tRNA (adenosine(37)-N6)-dimethylallyltransferase MiaA [Streptococcus sp. 'caviae']OLN84271.1 tRNA (adenosine(37)-N6)-dimethylallyltransferase MiaA [Streptococcus sp. 'caviae']
MKEKILVVLGPTAVGKTALGIELAQKYGGEIISGDSQQVYRKLDIGTAKASAAEQAAVPHHLLDVRDVSEGYSAFDFVQEAASAVEAIRRRGHLPIIVGGTGLYLQSLLEGYHLGGEVNQEDVLNYRKELEELSDQELFSLLEAQGIELPEFNRRRATRALELHRFSQGARNHEKPYDFLLLGLSDDRQRLYERINQRVDQMMAQGLLDEARWLYENYPQSQASRGIGYKELFPYFAGEVSLEAAVAQIKQNTRRFAKRQLTWFKNRMAVDFYMVSEADCKMKIDRAVLNFLGKA